MLQNLKVFDFQRQDPSPLPQNLASDRHIFVVQPDIKMQRIICIAVINGKPEQIPFLAAGIPAFLSIYFDLFSGFVQAFVFSLLTMVYVGGACPPPEELPEDRRAILEKRAAKKLNKAK